MTSSHSDAVALDTDNADADAPDTDTSSSDPRTWNHVLGRLTAAMIVALAAQPLLSNVDYGPWLNSVERLLAAATFVGWIAVVLRQRWPAGQLFITILRFVAAASVIILTPSLILQAMTGMLRPGTGMLLISASLGWASTTAILRVPTLSLGRTHLKLAAKVAIRAVVVIVAVCSLLSWFMGDRRFARDTAALPVPQAASRLNWTVSMDDVKEVLPAANGVVTVRSNGLTALGADGEVLWEYRRVNAIVSHTVTTPDLNVTAMVWKVGRSQLVVIDNLTGKVLLEKRIGGPIGPLAVDTPDSLRRHDLTASNAVIAVADEDTIRAYSIRTGSQVWSITTDGDCTVLPNLTRATLGGILTVTRCGAVHTLELRNLDSAVIWGGEMAEASSFRVDYQGRLVDFTSPNNLEQGPFDTSTLSLAQDAAFPDPPRAQQQKGEITAYSSGRAIGSSQIPVNCDDTNHNIVIGLRALACVATSPGYEATVVLAPYNQTATALTLEGSKGLQVELFSSGGVWIFNYSDDNTTHMGGLTG